VAPASAGGSRARGARAAQARRRRDRGVRGHRRRGAGGDRAAQSRARRQRGHARQRVTLARRLAEFAAALRFEDIPPAVVASVRLRALDILGIALAATTAETAPSVLGALEGWGASGDCTVIGAKRTAAPGAFHARGWHATAVCGPFAAALVAGRLERLDADRLTAALGIAGSFASGVLEHLEDGSWVKRVHPGWAGHAGAIASALARGGFTGPATILDGRFGFYRTFLGAEPDVRPFATLGHEWETLAIGFKPYPCCHYNHAYLDCALDLRRVHGVNADAVES